MAAKRRSREVTLYNQPMAIENPQGIINYDESKGRGTDYLYRVSLKCLVKNDQDQVLVVKETGRDWWDLPGGGMDHGEDFKTALAREMQEEVNYSGDFTYRIIAADDPGVLKRANSWQIRLVFELKTDNMTFSPGADGDEVAFMNPDDFQNSADKMERLIYKYSRLQGSL